MQYYILLLANLMVLCGSEVLMQGT